MPYLRPLDALHLEAAISIVAAVILTYDRWFSGAVRSVELATIAPEVPEYVQIKHRRTWWGEVRLASLI